VTRLVICPRCGGETLHETGQGLTDEDADRLTTRTRDLLTRVSPRLAESARAYISDGLVPAPAADLGEASEWRRLERLLAERAYARNRPLCIGLNYV
jgi:hypothetical protein